MKKLTAIIINYNTTAMTARSVQAFLEAANNYEREVILIDNGSSEPMTWASNDNVKLILNSTNLGFAKACNQGLKEASGDYVLLLNSDVIISRVAIDEMINLVEAEKTIGIVGPAFYYPNNKFQTSCGRFPNLWRELVRFSMLGKILPTGTLIYKTIFNQEFFTKKQTVDWVSGGCLLISQAVIKKVGLFDENFFFGVEDFDYCYRTKLAGYQVAYLPTVKIIHYHGFSSGGRRSTTSLRLEGNGLKYFLQKYYQDKWLFRLIDQGLYQVKIFILDLLLGKK